MLSFLIRYRLPFNEVGKVLEFVSDTQALVSRVE